MHQALHIETKRHVMTSVLHQPTQIVQWLRSAGPVAMGELTRRFKKRLTTDAQRKSFGATIKAVAVHKEVTPGAGKVIMLKSSV